MTDESDNSPAPPTGKVTETVKMPEKVRQPHGGAIYAGGVPGNRGGWQPKESLRRRLRRITDDKGLAFLDGVLSGEVSIAFVGTCPHCKTATVAKDFDHEYLQRILDRVETTIDHRLKASEQALKYGLGVQTEAVSPEEIQAQAKRMLDVLVDDLVTRGWSLADVQALATKMAVAASNDEPEG